MIKKIGTVIGFFIALIVLTLAIMTLTLGGEYMSMKWRGFMNPKWANVERETFEQTQSYTHGKITLAAKYYREYREGDEDEKQAIKNLVQLDFNTFDVTTIDNPTIRNWIVTTRGF